MYSYFTCHDLALILGLRLDFLQIFLLKFLYDSALCPRHIKSDFGEGCGFREIVSLYV